MNFWDRLPRPFTALAPMEDVTDVVFRHTVARAARPDVFFTEFTNVDAFASWRGRASTAGRLTFTSDECPIVAQIWGTKPENFALTASALERMGFSGIDINMGCPAKDVVKIGGGSGLIHTPALAAEIIRSARAAVELPISVKTRLGYSKADEYKEWLPVILGEHPANLTVHLRTRKEMSNVPAHYELIPEIIALRDDISPETKLSINGDITDWAQIKEIHNKYSAVDGYMIGRGVFSNIYCFDDSEHVASRDELIRLFRFQLDEYDKYKRIDPTFLGDYEPNDRVLCRDFNGLKHFVKVYIKDFPTAADLRAKIYACQTTDEIRTVLNNANLS